MPRSVGARCSGARPRRGSLQLFGLGDAARSSAASAVDLARAAEETTRARRRAPAHGSTRARGSPARSTLERLRHRRRAILEAHDRGVELEVDLARGSVALL